VQICDLAEHNFSQSLQILQFVRNLCKDIYVFLLKFAFSVVGWRAINFCANWAPYSYQHKIHLTHNTTDAMCFMQTLLIIQRTRLYYGYRTVFLKQNHEKLFVATTKHLRATFGQFFADFQRIFQLNLRATCTICAQLAQIAHNFSAFSVQFLRKFCIFSAWFSSGTDKAVFVQLANFCGQHRLSQVTYNSPGSCRLLEVL